MASERIKMGGDLIRHHVTNAPISEESIFAPISNFLNTLTHENRILQEQISLFVNYISFFHISQKKQLKNLHTRIDEFYNEVDENININYTYSINDIEEEDTDLELLNDNANDLMNNIENMNMNMNEDYNTLKKSPVQEFGNNDVVFNDKMELKEFKSISEL